MGRAETHPCPGFPGGSFSPQDFLKSPAVFFFCAPPDPPASPAARKASAWALTCSNWASRSGWSPPSWVLRLACRLYPSSCSNPTSQLMGHLMALVTQFLGQLAYTLARPAQWCLWISPRHCLYHPFHLL